MSKLERENRRLSEQQVNEVLERLSTLVLPGEANAETVDNFTHQLLVVGLRDLGIGVTGTTLAEEIRVNIKSYKSVYFYGENYPVRERNFSLLTHIGGKVLGIETLADKTKSFSADELDLSPVYSWEKRVVKDLRKNHPESIFVRGLQQALIDCLPQD